MKPTDNNTEQVIIEAARQVFIEKGYAEANMSDIAVKAGINRSGLHYYFRTKDRMFEAVAADIVHSFLPDIHHIVLQDKPIAERISEIVDVYFNVIKQNPQIPAFAIKEIQRDSTFFLKTINKMDIGDYMNQIRNNLLNDMENGKINRVPIEFVFYTLYGLLTFPFLSRPLTALMSFPADDDFEEKMQEWEKQIVDQLCCLLCK